MLFVVSGEGVSDIGGMGHGPDGPVFVPGPMTWLLDKMIEARWHYSPHGTSSLCFVSKEQLVGVEPKHYGRRFNAPGKRRAKETGYYYENARRLVAKALELAIPTDEAFVPVLFRDADGTQSASRGQWRDKWDSMLLGFEDAGCESGVPMLPMPKSEAWLLCALRTTAYQHCAALEQESGNDNSPNPLKAQLDHALGGVSSAAALSDLVRSEAVDPTRIDMPSFSEFRHRLNQVLNSAQN